MKSQQGSHSTPPAVARRLALLFLSGQERSALDDELEELFGLRLERQGPRQAGRWYWRQALRFPLLRLADRLRFRFPRRGARKNTESFMISMLQELRLTIRSLGKNAGLALVVILTLALAIGANTAIFSLLHTALLRPLPYRDASRLVHIYSDSPPYKWHFSVVDFLALREQQTHFADVAAYYNRGITLSGDGPAERLRAQEVTAGYFALLGIEARLGRTFRPGDDRPEASPSVLLSHHFWQDRLGGDPQALGRTLKLDGRLHTIVGIMPPLQGPLEGRADLWPCLRLETPSRKGPFFLRVLGRLKAAAAPQQAVEELRAINRRLFPLWQESYQDQRTTWGMETLSSYVAGSSGPVLGVLLAAVGFVLLVACVNIANLMLVRSSSRRRELALRAALGASQRRLLRLFLGESLLLALAGGLAGLVLGAGLLQVLQASGVAGLPRLQEASLSWTVLGFSAALSILSGLFFGTLPALQSANSDLAADLRGSGTRASSGLPQRRLRSLLAALEVALAVPLLIGAGLMANSFLRLVQVDPGIDARNLLTMNVYLPPSFVEGPLDAIAFWKNALPQLEALPGVDKAALSSGLPPDRANDLNNFDLEDQPTPAGESQPVAPYLAVTPGYFSAMGIPLLEGRWFDERDDADALPAALVDRNWAERFYPGKSPLGRRFRDGGGSTWTTVVGVVGNVKYLGLNQDAGAIYVPYGQAGFRSMYINLRTAGSVRQLEQPVRRLMARLAPDVAVADVLSMQERLQGSVTRPRHLTALVSTFAGLALLLALIGIYGVLSWFVNQERKEIGIRMALGGPQGRLFWSVVGRGMRWSAVGLLIGLPSAWALSRFLDGMLYGVAATDPATYLAVAVGLCAVSVLACALPARRAVRVDPLAVLKVE